MNPDAYLDPRYRCAHCAHEFHSHLSFLDHRAGHANENEMHEHAAIIRGTVRRQRQRQAAIGRLVELRGLLAS